MSMGAIGRSVAWFVSGVVLASAGWLLAVQAWHHPGANQDPRVLRSYNVRPELAFEVRNSLNSALGAWGLAGVAPNGQIVVNAPESYQKGVEQLLKEVASYNPPATPSVHIEAWFVTATPGSPVESAALKEVEPALRALEQSRGPTRFELLEELSTQVQPGESRTSDVRGARASMDVGVSVLRESQDHPIVAAQQLRLRSNQGPGISAQTELQPGKFLVLGQSGFPDKGTSERQLYYIVRATL